MEDRTAASPKQALLLIDFQRDFLAADGRMPVARTHVDGAIAAARAAIGQARVSGQLVVKIGNEFKPNDLVRNILRHHAAMAGSPGADWDPRLDADAPYLAKWKGDAFCNPELPRVLADNGIEDIILTGLFAGACIAATAKGALRRGLQVHVLTAAIACRTDASRHAACERLRKLGVQLVTNDDPGGIQP